MRPAILDKLFAPVTTLPGIGAQLAKLFERLAGPLVLDLLWHLPTGIVDRRAAPAISALNPRDWPDAVVTVKLRVDTGAPEVDSVVDVFPTANFQEREIYDMFGVVFRGHPDLRRILMPEDYEGYPQRRDFPVGGEPVIFTFNERRTGSYTE